MRTTVPLLVVTAAAVSAATAHAVPAAERSPAIVFVRQTSATTSPDLAVRTPSGRVRTLTRDRIHDGPPVLVAGPAADRLHQRAPR